MKQKNIFITTPIYYASGDPHIGHAYTTVLADVISRYKKLIGHDVFFLTGMDEHGQKILEKAESARKKPKDFVDEIASKFKDLWSKLDIDYSVFARTTDQNHCDTVTKVFRIFHENKFIYLDNWQGLYCVQCEENYTKSQAVKKDGDDCLYCKVGHKLTTKKEESYFLKISQFQDWLKNFLATNPNFIYPENRLKELNNNFIDQGITDLSVSRTTYDWGIKVPGDDKHVIYVWIDALMIYLSGLGYLSKDDSNFKKYWENEDSQIIQLMSKEITRFHCIYWPIMLEMLGLRKPTNIISHGWIVTDKGKMSKSLGNVIDPNEYIQNYGSDALRYFLCKEISIENDGVFSKELFINTFNNDLANNYGNLVSRSIGMLTKYTNRKVIKPDDKYFDELDKSLITKSRESVTKINDLIEQTKIQAVLETIIQLGNAANKYIEDKKPWVLLKESKTNEVNAFLFTLFNVVRIMTTFLSPVLVKGTKEAINQLNLTSELLNVSSIDNFDLSNNHQVNNSSPIYLRIK